MPVRIKNQRADRRGRGINAEDPLKPREARMFDAIECQLCSRIARSQAVLLYSFLESEMGHVAMEEH